MKKTLNYYERVTVKRLAADGFSVVQKPDDDTTIKAPDFLFKNVSSYSFIAEVKEVGKMPKKVDTIKDGEEVLGYRLESDTVVDNVLSTVSRKREEYVTKYPEYSKDPYVFFVYNCEMLWDRFGFLNTDLLTAYPGISAIFKRIPFDPQAAEWKDLNLEELETYIQTKGAELRFRQQYAWEVVKNPAAANRIDLSNFRLVRVGN